MTVQMKSWDGEDDSGSKDDTVIFWDGEDGTKEVGTHERMSLWQNNFKSDICTHYLCIDPYILIREEIKINRSYESNKNGLILIADK